MPDSSAEPAIFQELESLFAWNPLPFSLATKEMGGSFSTNTRDPAWYDMHLAPDRICKKLVHVKDLHKKIAAVVDDKLRKIRDDGITLQSPTVVGFIDKETRDDRLDTSSEPQKDEGSLQQYYQTYTAEFCVRVASALVLHPHIWKKCLWWSGPMAKGDAICDGSLQVVSKLNQPTRLADGTTKHSGPPYVDADLWDELMEVHEKYGDLATWEIKSLSVGDAGVMLGVVAMAAGVETFAWKTCKNPHHPAGKKQHLTPKTTQLLDDPATMSRFGLDNPQVMSQTLQPPDFEKNDILNDSLRRGGSSLKKAFEFDQRLMAEAKGLVWEQNQGDGNPVEDAVSAPVFDSAARQASQVAKILPDPGDSKVTRTPLSLVKSVIRRFSQDDQGSSTDSADGPTRKSRSATRKSSLSSKEGVSKIKFGIPTDLLKRKKARSKSPKKKAARIQDGDDAEDGMEGGTGDGNQKEPLTAQSIVQQAWAQGVHAQSTVVIIHSGNYEYVCIRHRATQTLYVSDILHVPFLEQPGYGKLQIGIYITALDDALGRNRLEKAQINDDDLPGDDGDQGPGPSDHGNNDDADDDTDEPKRKRRKGPDSNRENFKSRATGDKDWGTRQAKSQDELMLHLQYDIYDSIHPALFNRGPRYPDACGIYTPPTSPSYLPQKNHRFELFLTSEIGQRSAGVLHSGVVEVESDEESASLDVTAKLAFTPEHQRKLSYELFMYTVLQSKGIKGVPTALGVFHEVEENGPSCLVTSYAGASLEERRVPITAKQRSAFLAILNSIHDVGMVHGNLRLNNLLINDSGDITIADFDQATISFDKILISNEHQLLADLLNGAVDGSIYEGTGSLDGLVTA